MPDENETATRGYRDPPERAPRLTAIYRPNDFGDWLDLDLSAAWLALGIALGVVAGVVGGWGLVLICCGAWSVLIAALSWLAASRAYVEIDRNEGTITITRVKWGFRRRLGSYATSDVVTPSIEKKVSEHVGVHESVPATKYRVELTMDHAPPLVLLEVWSLNRARQERFAAQLSSLLDRSAGPGDSP